MILLSISPHVFGRKTWLKIPQFWRYYETTVSIICLEIRILKREILSLGNRIFSSNEESRASLESLEKMGITNKKQADNPIALDLKFFRFSHEIERRSGVNTNLCWHCKSCTNGCPFSHAMDYPPNRIVRLVQLGLKKETLESSAIWICVGCNTCAVQCPNAIDISAVADALRQMAIEEGVAVAEPDILTFHKEVLNSIEKHGRTHKLEIMARYKLRKRDWFADAILGVKMLAKKKLELFPSKIRAAREIRRLIRQKQLVKPYAESK